MLTFKPEIHSDESFTGYLLRLAEDNFLSSPTDLLRTTGLRLKASYTSDEIEKLATSVGLDTLSLQHAAEFDSVAGSLAQGRFLRKLLIPVCPECLSESPHIRQAWHHELVTACSAHQTQLIHSCPECDSLLDLNRSTVAICRCGFSLAEVKACSASPADILVATTIGGSGAVLALTGDGVVPPDVDSFLLFLANLSLTPPHRKNAAISFEQARRINDACLHIAQDLYPNFRKFVQQRVARANELASGRFISNLGAWYRQLPADFPGDEFKSIRDVVSRVLIEEAKAPLNRKMKQIGAELLGMKSTYTASEAARVMRSSPDRIIALVKTGKLKGSILNGVLNQFCLVDRQALEKERAAAEPFIDSKEVMKRLVITRRLRDRLVGTGVLQRVPGTKKPLFAKGDFLASDVEDLIQRLANNTRQLNLESTWSLEDISGKRFTNQSVDETFRRIFEGNIRPAFRHPDIEGIGAFRFDPVEIKESTKIDSHLVEFTITDLVKATRWKHESIKSWIDTGLLGCRRERAGRSEKIYISLTNLIEFLSKYSVSADAAARLNSRSVWITKALNGQGVMKNTLRTSDGALRGCLISVDALINVVSGREPGWIRSADKMHSVN
ncbi:TniQ family protein [Halopseudomonas bauzanensis]|uniref:TniQ family protein n=1 Tax=Halopseudomonas bauzanensis TaxID=653930 RepID=UPI0035237C42